MNIFKNMDDTLPRLNIFKLKTVSGPEPVIPYCIGEVYEGTFYPVLGLPNTLDYFVLLMQCITIKVQTKPQQVVK